MLKKQIDVPLEVKELSEDGTFSGYASVYGVEDLDGDVIEHGAFKDAKPGIPMLWQHNPTNPIGVYPVLKNDDKGLYVEGKLVLEVQQAKEAYALMKAGVPLALSVGFSVPPGGIEWDDKKKVRRIKTAELWEASVVTFPANPQAKILSVKRATRFRDLPLAPRDRAWDRAAAERRVRRWAGAEDEPNERYRQAFFWYDDSEPENFGSYKLMFADVVDGELRAVPRGVFAAAAAIEGARGGVNLPSGDVPAVRRHIARYYAKMSDEWGEELLPPWEKSAGEAFADLLAAQADLIERPKEFEAFLRDAGFHRDQAKAIATRYKDAVMKTRRDAEDEDADELIQLMERIRKSMGTTQE